MALQYRMAETNYPIRVISFGYSLLVFVCVFIERGTRLDFELLAWPVLALLVYPHLAHLHTRLRGDSSQAELDNLVADSVVLGMIVAQAGVPTGLAAAALVAVCINNAACGGGRRLAIAVALLAAAMFGWKFVSDTPFNFTTGPLVAALCMAGVAGYVAAVGLVMHAQTGRLIRMRNALARSESQFRFIAEHTGDFIAVLDSRGHIRYVSGSYEEKFDPNLMRSGAHWTGLVQMEDRERARRFVLSVLRTGRGARFGLNFTAIDGTPLYLECAASRLDEAGVPGNFLLMIISRSPTQLEAGMQRRFSEELKRHHAAYGVLVTDILGRIEAASPRMSEMLGYSGTELIGKTIGEIAESIPASDVLIDDVSQALDTQRTFQCKFLALDKNGKLKLAWANVVELQLHAEDGARRLAWTIVDDPVLTIAQGEEQEEPSSPGIGDLNPGR